MIVIYSSNNTARYNKQPVPVSIATKRHEIYCKVMFRQKLSEAEKDIFIKHIAPAIIKHYTGK